MKIYTTVWMSSENWGRFGETAKEGLYSVFPANEYPIVDYLFECICKHSEYVESMRDGVKFIITVIDENDLSGEDQFLEEEEE